MNTIKKLIDQAIFRKCYLIKFTIYIFQTTFYKIFYQVSVKHRLSILSFTFKLTSHFFHIVWTRFLWIEVILKLITRKIQTHLLQTSTISLLTTNKMTMMRFKFYLYLSYFVFNKLLHSYIITRLPG